MPGGWPPCSPFRIVDASAVARIASGCANMHVRIGRFTRCGCSTTSTSSLPRSAISVTIRIENAGRTAEIHGATVKVDPARRNPEHRCSGVQSAELDGACVDPDAIPLINDGDAHDVVVRLGDPAARVARPAPLTVEETR